MPAKTTRSEKRRKAVEYHITNQMEGFRKQRDAAHKKIVELQNRLNQSIETQKQLEKELETMRMENERVSKKILEQTEKRLGAMATELILKNLIKYFEGKSAPHYIASKSAQTMVDALIESGILPQGRDIKDKEIKLQEKTDGQSHQTTESREANRRAMRKYEQREPPSANEPRETPEESYLEEGTKYNAAGNLTPRELQRRKEEDRQAEEAASKNSRR